MHFGDCLVFLDVLVDSSLFSLVLQETYRLINLAFHADLSFVLSFDKAILKNLGHWLGLQTLGRGIPVFTEDLPLWDIVVTAFHRGSEDLLCAIPFVAQIFMAGSCNMAFLPCPPCVNDILSLLAWLHTYPHIGLRCILEIEILFNHLSLQLSDFQPPSRNPPSSSTSFLLSSAKCKKLCLGNNASISIVPCVQPKISSVQLRKYSQHRLEKMVMTLLIKTLSLSILTPVME